MIKLKITIFFIFLILITSGCTSLYSEEYEFYLENIENGILTYVGGNSFYFKIFSIYKIENIGDVISKNAILKINIFLNNKVIHQELIDIEPIKPGSNVTKKLSFNYDKHENDNIYRLIAEIIVENRQIIFIEDTISS